MLFIILNLVWIIVVSFIFEIKGVRWKYEIFLYNYWEYKVNINVYNMV